MFFSLLLSSPFSVTIFLPFIFNWLRKMMFISQPHLQRLAQQICVIYLKDCGCDVGSDLYGLGHAGWFIIGGLSGVYIMWQAGNFPYCSGSLTDTPLECVCVNRGASCDDAERLRPDDQKKLHILKWTILPQLLLKLSHLCNITWDSVHCCFSAHTALFFSSCSPASACLKSLLCVFTSAWTVPLNLSIQQSGPIGTLHSISTSLFISSLGLGVSGGQMRLCFHEC